MIFRSAVLLVALAASDVNGLSSSTSYLSNMGKTAAPPAVGGPAVEGARPMPPPHGAIVEETEGRVPGAYMQQAHSNWWDQRGPIQTHESIKSGGTGAFATYTEACAEPYSQKVDGPEPARVAGSYNQQATGNWWDRCGPVQTYDSIQRQGGEGTGAFSTCTEANMGPYTPKVNGPEPTRVAGSYNQQATGNWWDRAGSVETHDSIQAKGEGTGAFSTYTEASMGPYTPKVNGPEPARVAGSYNQQATGNWWDRAGSVETHDSIQAKGGKGTGVFATYTEANMGECKPQVSGPEPARVAGSYNQQATGNWWDRAGSVQTHGSIPGTGTGAFSTYTEASMGDYAPKNDGPEPTRMAGSYNQQATGNWWDRRGPIQTHDSIPGTGAGAFSTYTDMVREQNQ